MPDDAVAEYRRQAADCRELARRCKLPADAARWTMIAEKWEALAVSVENGDAIKADDTDA